MALNSSIIWHLAVPLAKFHSLPMCLQTSPFCVCWNWNYWFRKLSL